MKKGGYMQKKTLREWRISKGMTSAYVSNYLGIQARTLNYKERKNSFTMQQVKLLCDLFGISIEEIA